MVLVAMHRSCMGHAWESNSPKMSGNSHSPCNSSVTLKFKLCGSSGYPCASAATPVPIGSPKTYARADGFRDTRGFWNAMAMARYYRPELDVLRCFAFLMVFASHTVPVSTAAGGAFGVNLYFTLSSFLITTLLLRESSVCGALDVTAFYLR